jgi:hypothetical protein
MKILVTALAIALTIGTAIAALHPPGASLREEPATPPLQSTSIPIPPPTRVKTVAYREVRVFSDFPPFPTKSVKTVPFRP